MAAEILSLAPNSLHGMACLACGTWGGGPVCPPCRAHMRRSLPRPISESVWVHAAFVHDGAARRLVHRLKYDGLTQVAGVFAPVMAGLLPAGASCLVPVPRVVWRRIRYGVDPAAVLAAAIAEVTECPVVEALQPALVGPHHAGRSRSQRSVPIFHLRRRPPAGAILVDDVITTGITMQAAVAASGVTRAVAATAAGWVTSLHGGGWV